MNEYELIHLEAYTNKRPLIGGLFSCLGRGYYLLGRND